MEKLLTYGNFQGTIEYSKQDKLYHGKIKNIHGTVLYEASSLDELQNSFEESVKEYIDLCKKSGTNRVLH
jgi:predicted HicB family RNase H-like nuclease